MRKLLILFLLLSVPFLVVAEDWTEVITATYAAGLNDVQFLDDQNGWIVGGGGLLLKTTDGGITWTEVNVPTTLSLNSIFFVDENVGYIGGGTRTILKTVDGGLTWTDSQISTDVIPENVSMDALFFYDEDTGFALSSQLNTNARVVKTTDGGVTWEIVFFEDSDAINDMAFHGSNGIIVGRTFQSVYYSTDSGDTWEKGDPITVDPAWGILYSRSDLRAVTMLNDTTAHVVGWGTKALGLQPSIHLRTTDGGQTWEFVLQPEEKRTYDNLWGIHFTDQDNGFVVGGSGVIINTTDGGTIWEVIDYPLGTTMNAVHGVGDMLVAVGASGVIIRSDDGGATWELLTPMPNIRLDNIQIVNQSVGYAAGFNGIFVKTIDGGQTWVPGFMRAEGTTENIQDMHFVDENIGYVACSFRMVAKTVDGGQTWTQVIPDTTAAVVVSAGVYFTDADHGVVVGRKGARNDIIYVTRDGGNSWTIFENLVDQNLNAVAFGSSDNGVIVGNAAAILYTNDGGTNWNVAAFSDSVPTANLNDVAFVDENTVVAVGNEIILKSTDAGATWEVINSGTETNLNGVAFVGNPIGYAVGRDEVLKSADRGDSWENIIDLFLMEGNTLYSVDVDVIGGVWVSAMGGTIYNLPGTIEIPISDVYYIPKGTHEYGFNSLAEAIEALRSIEIETTVTLYIDDDLNETGNDLDFTGITLSEENNLVIKPAPDKTPVIITDRGVYIEGVSYITIDGSNSDEPERHLAIMYDAAGAAAIWIAGNSHYVTIKNIIVGHTADDIAVYGSAGIRVRRDDAATMYPTNITIENCQIGSLDNPFKDGIQAWGTGSPLLRVEADVLNSDIYASHRGITTFYMQESHYSGNTIYVTGQNAGPAWYAGVYLAGGSNMTVTNNDFRLLGVSDPTGKYIAAVNINLNAGFTDIYNNFVSVTEDFTNYGTATDNRLYGIATHREGANESYNIYHNSFLIGASGETGRNAAIGFESGSNFTVGVTKEISASFDVRNNIMVNSNHTEVSYCIHWPLTTVPVSDYNNLYVTGENANIGYFDNAAHKDLGSWQFSSDLDNNSVSIAVEFESDVNLRLTGESVGDERLAGIPIEMVQTDIDGSVRNTVYPYMGAYEAPIPLSADGIVDDGLPRQFELYQNYPNPFNPSTTIQFAIPEQANVRLEIYNMLGQRVKVLVADEYYQPGIYSVLWNGLNESNLPVTSGTYIYRIAAGNFVESKRMIFIK